MCHLDLDGSRDPTLLAIRTQPSRGEADLTAKRFARSLS